MATIQIKDLNDSREMDREAMRAVTGGSSARHFNRIFRDSSVLCESSRVLDAFKLGSFDLNSQTVL